MRFIATFFTVISLVISVNCFSQNWQTSFEESKQLADRENKSIILVFSGSDWCGPCIKLDKNIWKSEEFIAYARDNYVMLRADFPRRKQNQLSAAQQAHNNKLAELYNTNGFFPLVVIFDSKGVYLGETGFKKVTPKKYIEILNAL